MMGGPATPSDPAQSQTGNPQLLLQCGRDEGKEETPAEVTTRWRMSISTVKLLFKTKGLRLRATEATHFVHGPPGSGGISDTA